MADTLLICSPGRWVFMAGTSGEWRPAGWLAGRHCIPFAAGAARRQPVYQPEGHLSPSQRGPAAAEQPVDPQVSALPDRCVRADRLVVLAPVCNRRGSLPACFQCVLETALIRLTLSCERCCPSWGVLFAGYFALNVPSGLALYWFVNNLLSTAQQVYLKSSYKPAFAGSPVIDVEANVVPPSRKKEKAKETTGAGTASWQWYPIAASGRRSSVCSTGLHS